jgi:hypothetical protein
MHYKFITTHFYNDQIQVNEGKLKNYNSESVALKGEIRLLTDNLESIKTEAQLREKEVRIPGKGKKNHLQDKLLSECKQFDEADRRCKEAEREAKRAVELADLARVEASAAKKEKGEAQRLAMERIALIERMERQVESLEREKSNMVEEIEQLRQSELDAIS